MGTSRLLKLCELFPRMTEGNGDRDKKCKRQDTMRGRPDETGGREGVREGRRMCRERRKEYKTGREAVEGRGLVICR